MMIAANAVFALVYVTNQLIGVQGGPIIQPATTPVANFSSVYDIFNSAYFVTSILSFILTWFATVLLLRSYSRKFGRAKYWILVSIPLVYFLSQFQSLVFGRVRPISSFRTNSVWSGLHIVFQCGYTSWWNFVWYGTLECSPQYQQYCS